MKPVEVMGINDLIPNEMLKRIKSRIYTVHQTLDTVIYHTKEPVPFSMRKSGTERHLKIGETWGDVFDCAWFHFTGEVPASCKGQKVVLILDVGGEGCIYDDDGNPKRGITSFHVGQASDHDWAYKRIVQFIDVADGGEKVDIWVDCANNDLFGNTVWGATTLSAPRPFSEAYIATVDDEMRDFYYDYLVLNDLRNCIHIDNPRYYSIVYALSEVKNILINWTEDEIKRARKLIKKELNKKGGTPSLTFSAVGHSHLDLAWLWPIRESKRKAVRTFSTQLEMIDRYDGYIYGASQPQMFEWVKENEPALFGRIKSAVAKGRIEPQGCMWVEPDLNVSSGEALVRQIYYGKKFFKDEFGYTVETLWLPDVFGFNGALPQLCAKSDIKYLCTIKLSWNWLTPFPHHSFKWRGISDDMVLVHMPPEGTYNSAALPTSAKIGAEKYIEKGKIDRALMVFGLGDGGAGPSPKHLETISRMKNLQGIYPVKMESAIDFFKKFEKQADKMPTYVGEMYLEAHQGTYTSQSKNKRHNKIMETLLHNLEGVYAVENAINGMEFPQEEVDKIWKEVLLYQFHDILPGSSIKRVYNETEVAYQRLEKAVNQLIDRVLAKKEANAVFNPHGFEINDLVKLDDKYYSVNAKPLGYTLIDKTAVVDKFNCKATGDTLSNDKVVAKFDKAGRLISVVRKSDGRNAISDIGGNVFSIYHDQCTWKCGDAWDIDPTYFHETPERPTLISVETYVQGDCAVREQVFTYGKSTITQKIILRHGGEILEFENSVDWQEINKMLRVDFNTDINTDHSVCGIQFGKINRTTKQNNFTDRIQFEICAHRYVTFTENEYKFALLSDCKYGYRAKDKTISLDLLRSPEYPTTEEKGVHEFRFAVYCGKNANDVEKVAYKFINGLKPCFAEGDFSLASVDKDGVLTETLKPAYSRQGQVLRMYESLGEKTDCVISVNPRVKTVTLCNLLEEPIKVLPVKNGKVKLTFKAFEIHTLLLN